MFFPAPPPLFFLPHSTHSPLDSNRWQRETETFDPMTFDFKEMYIDSCVAPPGDIDFHMMKLTLVS